MIYCGKMRETSRGLVVARVILADNDQKRRNRERGKNSAMVETKVCYVDVLMGIRSRGVGVLAT
jgi:hypothetical protein